MSTNHRRLRQGISHFARTLGAQTRPELTGKLDSLSVQERRWNAVLRFV